MTQLNDEKLKMMEDEMNRFEEEIGLPNLPLPPSPPKSSIQAVIGANTFNQVQAQLNKIENAAPGPGVIPPPPPPPPPPLFVPPQVQRMGGPMGMPMDGSGPPMQFGPPGAFPMQGPPMGFGPPMGNMPPMGPSGPRPMPPMGGPMGPGPMGPGHMGPGPMGPGPMGQGPMGQGPMGQGPMGQGPMGQGPMGPGPMGQRHMGPGPMGQGNMGQGHMGQGPMGQGHMGQGPMGSGPMGPGPMGSGPMGPGPMGPGPMGPMGHMGPMGPGPMGPGGPGGGPGPMPPMRPHGPGPMLGPGPGFIPPPPDFVQAKVQSSQGPVVLSGAPKKYNAGGSEEPAKQVTVGPEYPAELEQQNEEKKNKKQKSSAKEMAEKVKATTVVSTVHEAGAQPNQTNQKKKDKNKNKKFIRTAGGHTWEDTSLAEWEEDDFRLFCGDLGNDVTDEVLTRAFSKYASFMKAKVVRDKRTNKTKGFGFVSFKDPQDFIRATKEMNGRYVGSRPIKLRKSMWRNRSLDTVRKKDKEKAALIGLLTGRT